MKDNSKIIAIILLMYSVWFYVDRFVEYFLGIELIREEIHFVVGLLLIILVLIILNNLLCHYSVKSLLAYYKPNKTSFDSLIAALAVFIGVYFLFEFEASFFSKLNIPFIFKIEQLLVSEVKSDLQKNLNVLMHVLLLPVFFEIVLRLYSYNNLRENYSWIKSLIINSIVAVSIGLNFSHLLSFLFINGINFYNFKKNKNVFTTTCLMVCYYYLLYFN